MIQNAQNTRSQIVSVIQFEDFAVSWAGPGRDADEFCFGSEDGRLRFTTISGAFIYEAASEEDSEAVNGVAFGDSCLAISSRKEIAFWTLPQAESPLSRSAVIPCGAHGVLATAAGRFIAPLGPTGLMMAKESQQPDHVMTVNRIRAVDWLLDYYKVVNLNGGVQNLLACAVRRSGVAALELDDEGNCERLKATTFAGLDVVDVCALGNETGPRAVAALGREGTLVFFKDAMQDAAPMTLKFAAVHGVAYRIFSLNGSILVLTSRGLYIFDELAHRFAHNEPVVTAAARGRFIQLKTVDANLCAGRWLLVVMAEHTLAIDLPRLLEESPDNQTIAVSQSIAPTLLAPVWQPHAGAAESVGHPIRN